jgi:hypothetical protein
MHPEVGSDARAKCPICGMDLEAVAPSASVAGTRGKSGYETYDVARRRGYGPDKPSPASVDADGSVLAVVYADELVARDPGERAVFATAQAPELRVEVVETEEREPWDRSTFRVHFRPAEGGVSLRPHDVGWLRFVARAPGPQVVPAAAVLEGNDGPYVLVASSEPGEPGPRPIRAGRVFGGFAAIVSGLGASDRVLTGGALQRDAERRLGLRTESEPR